LPLLLAVVLIAVWLIRERGLRESAPTPESANKSMPADRTTGHTVSLTIDFGDGRRTQFKPSPWREGITVQDVTRETPSDSLRLETLGSGKSAFLASLDGIENEGASGRNWTYSVNGKMGDRSFAVYALQPGDQVLWTFGTQQ
jgi:hypothetical protein